MNKVHVAVYGTLKKAFGNHRVMQEAEGKFYKKDYIQVDRLSESGFPMIKLSKGSGRWLAVEIYEVDEDKVPIIDSLEGYREGRTPTFYDRKIVDTLTGEPVYVYEYVSPITDKQNVLERHITNIQRNKRYYDWGKHFNS